MKTKTQLSVIALLLSVSTLTPSNALQLSSRAFKDSTEDSIVAKEAESTNKDEDEKAENSHSEDTKPAKQEDEVSTENADEEKDEEPSEEKEKDASGDSEETLKEEEHNSLEALDEENKKEHPETQLEAGSTFAKQENGSQMYPMMSAMNGPGGMTKLQFP
jgi:hypothetical protein